MYFQCFFFSQGFLSQALTIRRTAEEGRRPSLFLCTASSLSWTFRHLFIYVRWLPRGFNRITWNYQTATRWDYHLYWITIWLIKDGMLITVCITWLLIMFLLQQFDIGNQCIWTQIVYQSEFPYSVWMQEYMDQKNSEYGHFLCSKHLSAIIGFIIWFCYYKRKSGSEKTRILTYFTQWMPKFFKFEISVNHDINVAIFF